MLQARRSVIVMQPQKSDLSSVLGKMLPPLIHTEDQHLARTGSAMAIAERAILMACNAAVPQKCNCHAAAKR